MPSNTVIAFLTHHRRQLRSAPSSSGPTRRWPRWRGGAARLVGFAPTAQIRPHFLFNTQALPAGAGRHPDPARAPGDARPSHAAWLRSTLAASRSRKPTRLGDDSNCSPTTSGSSPSAWASVLTQLPARTFPKRSGGAAGAADAAAAAGGNAIRHGLESRHIRQLGDRPHAGRQLVLAVTDTGLGLAAPPPPPAPVSRPTTMRRRLAALYGDAASASSSTTAGGATATLRLPLVHADPRLIAEDRPAAGAPNAAPGPNWK